MIIADAGSLPMMTSPAYRFTYFKVGMSDSPWSRCAEMQTGNPMQLSVYKTWKFDSRELARSFEKTFHEVNCDRIVRGEWFCDDPQGAWDSLSTAICLYAFESLCLTGESLLGFMTKTGMESEVARDIISGILAPEEWLADALT